MRNSSPPTAENRKELENRLHNQILATRLAFDAAFAERSKLVGQPESPDGGLTRREAFDREQDALNNYVQALRQYNHFISDGAVLDGNPEAEREPE